MFLAPNCSKTLDVTVTTVEHYFQRGLIPEAHDQYFPNVYGMYLLAMAHLEMYVPSFSFFSKTNQMHSISNLFYFETTLYMFRTVPPSIISSLRLYVHNIHTGPMAVC